MFTYHIKQAIFHFRAIKPGEDHIDKDSVVNQDDIIDDTRTMGSGPFELLIGRDFKLSVWEDMVKTMRVTEISRFICPFQVRRVYRVLLLCVHVWCALIV